jgi:hypothetical protein
MTGYARAAAALRRRSSEAVAVRFVDAHGRARLALRFTDAMGRVHAVLLAIEGPRRVLYALVDDEVALCLATLRGGPGELEEAAGPPVQRLADDYAQAVADQVAEAEAWGRSAPPSTRRFLCRRVEPADLEAEGVVGDETRAGSARARSLAPSPR